MRKHNFNLQLFADDFVDVDTLKQHGFTDDDLKQHMSEPETQKEPDAEPTQESEPTINEPTEPEPNAPDGDTVSKHVPYDRFKEVNEKNKILAAKVAALEAAQQKQQPVNNANQEPVLSREEQAEKKAREQCKIDNNVDVDDLQYSDPALYRKYIKALTKEEMMLELNERIEESRKQQVWDENVNFVQELQAIPDFPVLFQFAQQELDELPRKEAKKIDDAYARVDSGRGNKEDFAVLRDFANKCKEKMSSINGAPMTGAFSMPQNQQPAPAPTNSPLDKAANLPRSQNLSGAKTGAMSWSQVEQLVREGKVDQIPPDMLAQIPTGKKLLGLD